MNRWHSPAWNSAVRGEDQIGRVNRHDLALGLGDGAELVHPTVGEGDGDEVRLDLLQAEVTGEAACRFASSPSLRRECHSSDRAERSKRILLSKAE